MKKVENVTITLREGFKVLENGAKYSVPKYTAKEGEPIQEIDDTGKENDPYQCQIIEFMNMKKGTAGTLHEHLLAVQIHDLREKNKQVPSRNTAAAITSLEEALGHLRNRSIDRESRNVRNTTQK